VVARGAKISLFMTKERAARSPVKNFFRRGRGRAGTWSKLIAEKNRASLLEGGLPVEKTDQARTREDLIAKRCEIEGVERK